MKNIPTQSETEVQDYVAQWYQVRYSGSGFVYHSRIVTDMLDGVRMSDRRNDKILDVGCGTGFVSTLYPNFDIFGVDISEEMLKRNPHRHLNAPAEALPFVDNTFDWVVARSLLHHLDSPVRGLIEMARVLKPGGRFVCWDPNYSFLVNTFRKCFQHTDRFSHLHKSFTVGQLVDMLHVAGLQLTEVRYIGFLAYPLCGFPDIKNFHLPVRITQALMRVDEWMAKTPLRSWAWSVMVRAHK